MIAPREKANASATNGMNRQPDHRTSIAAAATVSRRKITIRQRVENFALLCAYGFIDESLLSLDPAAPESSFRKRRTELAEENIIIASEQTRQNSKGQDCIVWFHRDHVDNPPPLKPREQKPSRFEAMQNEIARLHAEIAAERDAVLAWLRNPSNLSVPTMDRHWTAAYNAALAHAAKTIAAGEHRQ